MARKSFEESTFTVGTEAWNVADGYVKLKILKQLVLNDKLETISIYGSEDIDEELNVLAPEMIMTRRINAIYRLKDNLKQLLSNVRFAIRKDDLPKLETLRARLRLVESMLDVTHRHAENQITKEMVIEINENWFTIMLNELQEIKEIIHTPINNAGLIFRASEEINFDDLLTDLAEGG